MTDRKIKIGMVLDQHFPPDARVEREALALISAGYDVHLLCEVQVNEAGAWQDAEEVYKGIRIHRINPKDVTFLIPFLNLCTRLPYRGLLKSLNQFLWNIDTVWHTLIRRFVYRFDIDVLHIHDLRLVPTGLAIAEKYDMPLVADLHENYPALMGMLKGRQDPERGRKARQKWERIEKYCTWGADRVITVIEEARDRLVLKGVRPQKILVLPNTVDMEKFEAADINPDVGRRYKKSFLMVYVGFVNSHHRGIHTVIEAMAELKDEIPELTFVAAGGYREDYHQDLQSLIDRYKLGDRVNFTGWLDETAFVSYIDAADICLCPHLSNDHTNTTFPNKVYLYHLFAKPVIASSCIPLMRYLDETGGGLYYQAGNPRDLAEKIRRLHDDATLRKVLGKQGRKAVLTKYNWKQTAGRLIEMYNHLTGIKASAKVPSSL